MALTQIKKAGLDGEALDRVFTIGASGSSAYTFQGEGLNGTVNNPTLYLTRGKTYRFENGSGGHPIRIQSTSGASGTAYNTGVTNNAGSGTVIVEVQHDAPDVLYYQCTSHAAMNGILYITGALADGGVTTDKLANNAVTNAKIADDAVTTAKIADNAIVASSINATSVTTAKVADGAITDVKLANNSVATSKIPDSAVTGAKIASGAVSLNKLASDSVGTAKIIDQAVTLAKLPHGTSSNDGKFLRANNGADPSFESVPSPAITSIASASNNRVITSNGGTTVNAEPNLTFDGSTLDVNNSVKLPDDGTVHYGASDTAFVRGKDSTDGYLKLGTAGYERLRVQSNGDVYLNPTQGSTGVNSGAIRRFNAGLDYWSGTAGSANAIKYAAHGQSDDNMYGMGISGSLLELQSQVDIGFFAGSAGGGTGRRVERARILSTGGLTFNGDTATANALDDYEEGTYTPSMTNGFDSGLTYSIQQGFYRKIGSLVEFNFYIQFGGGSNDTNGGRLRVSLPFSQNSSGYIRGHGIITYHNIASPSPDSDPPSLYIYGGHADCYSANGADFKGGNGSNQASRYFIGGGHFYTY